MFHVHYIKCGGQSSSVNFYPAGLTYKPYIYHIGPLIWEPQACFLSKWVSTNQELPEQANTFLLSTFIKGSATINSHWRDSESCRILAWFLDSWFHSSTSLLILVYQIRNYISHDSILRACTKIYRNNSGSLILDSRIT